MDSAFIQARITATQALIVVYEDAIAALATAGTQSYKLDTGQTVQMVTRLDLRSLGEVLKSLENRCATYEARLYGSTLNGRPAW